MLIREKDCKGYIRVDPRSARLAEPVLRGLTDIVVIAGAGKSVDLLCFEGLSYEPIERQIEGDLLENVPAPVRKREGSPTPTAAKCRGIFGL